MMNNKEWTETDDKNFRRLCKKFRSLSVADPTHDITFVMNLYDGKEAEQLVKKALTGEVKRDYRTGETGNVFVETDSRGNPSGISSSKSDYYIFIFAGSPYNDEVFIGISTARLRRLLESINYTVKGGDNNTSTGKLVRISKLIKP